jgi:hypothetical protein
MARVVQCTRPGGKLPTLVRIFPFEAFISADYVKGKCEMEANFNFQQAKHAASKPKPTLAAAAAQYKPTLQTSGQWRKVRGNTPGEVTEEDWIKAYNRNDSKYRKRNKWSTERAAKERESGKIRKMAILDLIAHEQLPANFKDTKP